MAIQPIDLQTLFTQLDKVGKTQSDQREGLHIQQALQGVRMQKKTEERAQAVNESQDTGEGAERIKDRNNRRQAGRQQGGGDFVTQDAYEEGEGGGEDPEEPSVIRDPALGKNIDVSG
jgi:hypothetical protein